MELTLFKQDIRISGGLSVDIAKRGIMDAVRGRLSTLTSEFDSINTRLIIFVEFDAKTKDGATVVDGYLPNKEWNYKPHSEKYEANCCLDLTEWNSHRKAETRPSFEPLIDKIVWYVQCVVVQVLLELGVAPEKAKEIIPIERMGEIDFSQFVASAAKRAKAKKPSPKYFLDIVIPDEFPDLKSGFEYRRNVADVAIAAIRKAKLGKDTGFSSGSGSYEIGLEVKDLEKAMAVLKEAFTAADIDHSKFRYVEL